MRVVLRLRDCSSLVPQMLKGSKGSLCLAGRHRSSRQDPGEMPGLSRDLSDVSIMSIMSIMEGALHWSRLPLCKAMRCG